MKDAVMSEMKNPWKISTFVLALALVLSMSIPLLRASGNQPHMTAALGHLRQAESELKQAAHNKAGHRVKAIALTRKAMVETKKGIKAAQ